MDHIRVSNVLFVFSVLVSVGVSDYCVIIVIIVLLGVSSLTSPGSHLVPVIVTSLFCDYF